MLQPRFAAGNPPDLVNNSGAEADGLRRAGRRRPAAGPDRAVGRAVGRRPEQEGPRHAGAGHRRAGTFNGKPYVLYYVSTVFGIWYSGKLFKDNGWTAAEDLGRVHRALRQDQGQGHRAVRLRRRERGVLPVERDPHQRRQDRWRRTCSRTSTTWRTAPGRPTPVKQAAEAWAEIGAKYMDKAPRASSTPSPAAAEPGQGGLLPRRRLAGERAEEGHAGRLRVPADADCPSLTASDKLPATALRATAGEGYFVSAKSKNPTGRHGVPAPDAVEGGRARASPRSIKSPTVVAGRHRGLRPSRPAWPVSQAALKAAGKDVVQPVLRRLVQGAGQGGPHRHQRADVRPDQRATQFVRADPEAAPTRSRRTRSITKFNALIGAAVSHAARQVSVRHRVPGRARWRCTWSSWSGRTSQAFQISLTNWRGLLRRRSTSGWTTTDGCSHDEPFWKALQHHVVLLLALPLVTIALALFFAFMLNVGGTQQAAA